MHSSRSLTALVVLCLSVTVQAIGPVTDLHIVNADVSPDGFTRPAVLANGILPGPVITGRKGDNFQINVIDELTDASMRKSTSIHWHGFFQKGTNWADGAAFVTQCPIVSGDSFLYNFTVPDQAGTYWYHSHLSTQYCDGLRGPFVVYDPYDPQAHLYDVDDESTVITLTDWYHAIAKDVQPPAKPQSTLINGLGRYQGQETPSDLAVITVERGKRYRMRLVSVSCDPNYKFSIDNHDMTVIEADGENVQSRTVDSITIFAGQRYSFILNANQPEGNYWIRAQPNIGTNTSFVGGLNSAILRYVGASDEEPTTSPGPDNTPLREVDLRPLHNPGVPGQPSPGGADVNHVLQFGFDDTHKRFTVDGTSYETPETPALLQILSGAQTAQDLLPKGQYIPLPANSVIELSMPAGVIGGPHPLHLHGHTFHVVRSAGSTTYNYNDPVMRDVVNIGNLKTDNVTIRFKTDNPGPWFIHCHIDWHFDTGFAIVMAEDVPGTAAANPVPGAWKELCPKYNATAPGDR